MHWTENIMLGQSTKNLLPPAHKVKIHFLKKQKLNWNMACYNTGCWTFCKKLTEHYLQDSWKRSIELRETLFAKIVV